MTHFEANRQNRPSRHRRPGGPAGPLALPYAALATALALLASLAGAAPAHAERLVIPVSDPGRPVTLRAAGLQATFTVEGYDGQEVIVETEAQDDAERAEQAERDRHGRHGSPSEPPPGMRRLPNAGFGLTAEERNNVVEVQLEGHHPARVHIRVPRTTSVHVSTVNGGDLVVRDVTGEHEIENVNGGITVEDVAGALVAHTTNGPVKVNLTRIDPGKPMSFVSFNGDVDVTFPPDLAAQLSLRSDNGEIYTDFDVDLAATGPVKKEERKGGTYRVTLERTLEAQVGAGGPEITLRTFNGNIYVRKGE